MFIPDPRLSIPYPGTRVDKIPDPGFGSASQNLIIFTQKTQTQKMFRMFIPDPGSGFYPIWIPVSQKYRIPDTQHRKMGNREGTVLT
jgi:hypothetical protein